MAGGRGTLEGGMIFVSITNSTSFSPYRRNNIINLILSHGVTHSIIAQILKDCGRFPALFSLANMVSASTSVATLNLITFGDHLTLPVFNFDQKRQSETGRLTVVRSIFHLVVADF